MGIHILYRRLSGGACALALALAPELGLQDPEPVAAAPAPPATSATGDAVRAVLDRLIAETNRLDAFLAEYELIDPYTTKNLELEFRAPASERYALLEEEDLLLMTVIVEGTFGETGSSDGLPAFRMDLGAAHARWLDELSEALRARAPAVARSYAKRTKSIAFGPRLDFDLRPQAEPDASAERFHLELRFGELAAARLPWLSWFRERADAVAMDKETLTLEVDGAVLTLSTSTGFLTGCTSGDGETRREVRLARLLRNDEVPGDLISMPGGIQHAGPDLSRDLRASVVRATRRDLEDFLHAEAAAGRFAFDEDSRAKLSQALSDFSSVAMAEIADHHLAAMKGWIDERAESLATWKKEQLGKGADPAEVKDRLRASLDDFRIRVDESLEKRRDGLLQKQGLDPADKGVAADPLLSLEDQAMRGAWDSVVSKPALAYFEAELRKYGDG